MVKLVRHPQTKERETDRLHLSDHATSRLYPILDLRRRVVGVLSQTAIRFLTHAERVRLVFYSINLQVSSR